MGSNNLGKLTADERASLQAHRDTEGMAATTALLLRNSPIKQPPTVVLPADQIPDEPTNFFKFVATTDEPTPVQTGFTDEELLTAPPPALDIPGLKIDQWAMMLTAAVHANSLGRELTVSSIWNLNRRINKDLLSKVIKHRNFGKALEFRGVTMHKIGLSERQMLTLSLVTDFTDKRSIKSKLEQVGVKQWEWQAWQKNPTFKSTYRQLSEQLFSEAQAAVNVSLTTNAVNGDLASQKYFNEMSGRWNPAQQSAADVKAILSSVVEILTSEIKDPELLRRIGGRLSMVAAAQGVK